MSQFILQPKGPFSFEQALGVFSRWAPVRRFSPADEGVLRLSFLGDGTFRPTVVALRERDGALVGETHGDVESAARQVARIFSLDHDGTHYPEVGVRDPKIGLLMASRPGLRPVCFLAV